MGEAEGLRSLRRAIGGKCMTRTVAHVVRAGHTAVGVSASVVRATRPQNALLGVVFGRHLPGKRSSGVLHELSCPSTVRAVERTRQRCWDRLLRSYSVAGPKDMEGKCWTRERSVLAGRLKDLKVDFGVTLRQRRRGRANQYGSTIAPGLRSPGQPHERSCRAQ